MARTVPPDRFAAVVAAASRVFVTHGYRRAQLQDVADELGLAKGTLYGYAQSKAALFAAAIRYADGHEPLPPPAELPLPAPLIGETATLVRERLATEVAAMTLTRALTATSSGQAGGELADIVTDLYDRLARHRIAIKLVDRCAPELPDLAAVWFDTGRGAIVGALATYLLSRQERGVLTLPGPAPLVARTVVELCALWAVHCYFDPAPDLRTSADAAVVSSTLSQLIARATAPH